MTSMASWKLNGVVPDSDDEGSLDSQSDNDVDDVDNGDVSRRNDLPDSDESIRQEDAGQGPSEDLTVKTSSAIERYVSGDLYVNATETSKPIIDDPSIIPTSSPARRPVFQVPQTLWHIGLDLTDSESETTGKPPSLPTSNPLPPADDISTTYIRLTSPLSSVLSSLPNSQQNGTSYVQPPEKDVNLDEGGTFSTSPEPVRSYRRSLRERAPIQLHPYAMEQEKYRQTLKARGIAPMRLAQSQDDDAQRRMHVPSSDPISQDLESQDVEQETEESQPMEFNWVLDSLPTERNVEARPRGSQAGVDTASNDDDEFPDIDELLRGKPPTARHDEPKHNMNTYSSKGKRPKPPRIQTQRIPPRVSGYIARDIFDVPASPPATSSPFPTTIRRVRRTTSQAISLSSKEPTPSWLEQDELNFQSPPDLPTPVKSAIKPTSESMLLDSDLDDDPFASEAPGSEQGEAGSTSSSSDESVQIRRVSKKIRGVLPASHLRLDQQLAKLKHSNRAQRDSNTASPEKSLIRRGVALSRAPRATQAAPSSTMNALPFISDDSDDEESDHDVPVVNKDNSADRIFLFEQSRMGFAEEEDRIDAMLPSLKRQGNFKRRSGKRLRVGSASLGKNHQPKITQHLVKGKTSEKQSRRRNRDKAPRRPAVFQDRRPKPPRLGILDVFDLSSQVGGEVPRFIKIAARTARSQVGQGRQSPSRKFIRLASREDTLDANSVLDEWKGGNILPRTVRTAVVSLSIASRPPLGHIADNQQTRLQRPITKTASHSQATKSGQSHPDRPRQLVVSKGRQGSIRNYAQQSVLPKRHSDSDHRLKAVPRLFQRRAAKLRSAGTLPRPAQLESSESAASDRILVAAFAKTKKYLDASFKLGRKRPVPQRNVQLDRFLADDDIVRPSVETASPQDPHVPKSGRSNSPFPTKVLRQRKKPPRRVDTGAARYRQHSEPLVLDALSPESLQEALGDGNKLMGLGKYGTRYTVHFDVVALQPGIFFHESTFIGGGRLSEAIKLPSIAPFGASRGQTSFRLGDKNFRWGNWNEDVSSEVGLFFDCLIDLLTQSLPPANSSDPTPATSIEFIITYVQHSVSFSDSASRDAFLSRMLETMQDFLSRVNQVQYENKARTAQHRIETVSRCSVVVLQLLQISRAVQATTTFQLEDLLKSASNSCAKLLVHMGFDTLRKLYDDLQHLSFRERGIRSDHYCASSWVISLRVLHAARIPKASFWDITNMALFESYSSAVDDVRNMEQMWFSVYALLPICEFDDFGVVIPGLRHKNSFDNWAIPQRLLRGVFALYSSNVKQPPGFNDYCRVLLTRCHYLIREWGWWRSSGMIGTVLDFFASHKLGHLRNEEVYKSPRFLEELDAEPSLEVEPEDRSFHIFLKIIALTIKRLRQTGDERGIRNLVARLLPNHDRQYPKDEDMHMRDLAALRNHHDLLCTLYWASPPDCRPSLSLIQQLVDADNSHKEACLINLRALDNLARFVFTSSTDESAIYKQFTQWELAFFDKILRQYLDTESEVRRLADQLSESNGPPIPEIEVKINIDAMRRSSMNTLRTLLFNLRDRINRAKDAEATLSSLNAELLSKILNPRVFEVCQDIEGGLVGDAIDALHNYMERANSLHPFGPQQLPLCHVEVDSQGSLNLLDLDIERQMMIYPLHEVILPKFASITRSILESHLYQRNEPSFMERLILCWARLVSFITEEKHALKSFTVNGVNAVFEHRHRHARTNKYWPLFISQLLVDKSSIELNTTGFDLGIEWMQIITSNPKLLGYEPDLSKQLYQKGHYLVNHGKLPVYEEWPRRHLHMLQGALNSMRMIKMDPHYGGFADNHRLSEKETQILFSASLKSIMDSMQQQLELMVPRSTAHCEYVKFCQEVVSHLRGYASSIRPVTDFFLQHSQNYWPKSDDPHLYAAGIVSYSLRLDDQRGKVPLELFHYLYSGWKNDQMHSRADNYMTCCAKGMRNWGFTEFMLENFAPAIILASFNTVGGCVLATTYLPVIARRTHHFLQSSDFEAPKTFNYLMNILKMMVNCIRVLVRLPCNQIGHDNEMLLSHKGMISISCHFWISIRPALMEYVDVHPIQRPILDAVESLLNVLIPDVAFYINVDRDCGTSIEEQRDVATGEYVERFVMALHEDMVKNWVVTGTGTSEWADDSVVVRITTGAREGGSMNIPLLRGILPFNEVLELWKSSSGGMTQASLNRQLNRTERGLGLANWMMAEHVERFPGIFRGFL